jgi:hypothetical protein
MATIAYPQQNRGLQDIIGVANAISNWKSANTQRGRALQTIGDLAGAADYYGGKNPFARTKEQLSLGALEGLQEQPTISGLSDEQFRSAMGLPEVQTDWEKIKQEETSRDKLKEKPVFELNNDEFNSLLSLSDPEKIKPPEKPRAVWSEGKLERQKKLLNINLNKGKQYPTWQKMVTDQENYRMYLDAKKGKTNIEKFLSAPETNKQAVQNYADQTGLPYKLAAKVMRAVPADTRDLATNPEDPDPRVMANNLQRRMSTWVKGKSLEEQYAAYSQAYDKATILDTYLPQKHAHIYLRRMQELSQMMRNQGRRGRGAKGKDWVVKGPDGKTVDFVNASKISDVKKIIAKKYGVRDFTDWDIGHPTATKGISEKEKRALQEKEDVFRESFLKANDEDKINMIRAGTAPKDLADQYEVTRNEGVAGMLPFSNDFSIKLKEKKKKKEIWE